MIDALLARFGEAPTLALSGLLIGVAFGFFAQRSRFCLRAAVIEFARSTREGRLTVWLFAFATAVVLTQAFALAGWFDASDARQLSARGSLSGAAIGGMLFGIGMILARGCASRLLVLAAHGNLRALLSGLVFAVTALSALSGQLAPLRLAIAQWWTVEGGTSRDLLLSTGIGHLGGLLFGAVWLLAALWWAWRQRVGFWAWFGAVGCGAMVALAWLTTYRLSRSAFDLVVPVQSLSFTGPAADVLWWVVAAPPSPLKFDLGLVPGVVIGSFASAALWRELKLEGFSGGQSMRRYIAGALLMGFGGMLAGGCAVGAGVSGASVFTVTAFVTLAAMWAGAAATDWLVDRHHETRAAPPGAQPAGAPGRAAGAGYAAP
ncbi:MAG: YeeE/YedE family protein [Burkholderiaceae bacterium]|nr:YeeE/YedE family protein [Burkholderiaceae bacterium]